MVKHESHFAAVAVDVAHAPAEGGDQIVDGLEQHIGQHGSLQVAPQSLDQVEAG